MIILIQLKEGIIFWQMKLNPQTQAAMSPEQEKQQKMMASEENAKEASCCEDTKRDTGAVMMHSTNTL